MGSLTPMMQQYMQIKEQYADALLFFRLGDFYEMFFDDAITASRELEITLTGRDCGLDERAPMCGIPHHSAENYICKLIEKGYKVAICEQIQDPAEAKGIVKREVVRIITPGTLLEASMLDEKNNNYLLCIFIDEDNYGLSYVDISTGEFFISEILSDIKPDRLYDEIFRINPREILINEGIQPDNKTIENIKNKSSARISIFHQWSFQLTTAKRKLLNHFSIHSLEGFGCDEMSYGICAAGALLEYLTETQKNMILNITKLKPYYPDSYMIIDGASRRNLELVETIRTKSKKGSLLWLMDKTNTAMGSRLLKNWIQQPLLNKNKINDRLDSIEIIKDDIVLLEELKEKLGKIYDLERLIGRITYGNANARDLLSLKQSFDVLPKIKELIKDSNSNFINLLYNNLDLLEDISLLISNSIIDEPSLSIKEGNIIKDGYNYKLDKYRYAMEQGKNWIAGLEKNEREKTGIKNLKIGFNKVFGYYIEVTKSYYNLVPENYIRKQTLANCERYITQELKEVEDSILGAEDKSIRLEYQLFSEIRNEIASHVSRIQKTAQVIANLDAIWSLAKVALENNYIRPSINTNGIISITDGRHPVVEKTLSSDSFVPNSTFLDMEENRLAIITGPNMAGKSTYMRQVALIVLMAQIGSFIPAGQADISIVDRVFTRVGASDDLSSGQSTFMVEMAEVANILNNATDRSLIILDEIGRGTSTYDGLSIAWSVIEHICDKNGLGAKTLFATHYHELTELEGKLPGVKNYCISVKEYGDDIVFLRKIIRGGANKSFGIQVAKLAGVPEGVIERAKTLLKQLETSDINNKYNEKMEKGERIDEEQITFFESKDSIIQKELEKIDINATTPLEALNILSNLIKLLKD